MSLSGNRKQVLLYQQGCGMENFDRFCRSSQPGFPEAARRVCSSPMECAFPPASPLPGHASQKGVARQLCDLHSCNRFLYKHPGHMLTRAEKGMRVYVPLLPKFLLLVCVYIRARGNTNWPSNSELDSTRVIYET